LVGPERQHRAGAVLDLEPAELVLVVIVVDELTVGLAVRVVAGEHELVLVPLGPRAIALAACVAALAFLVGVAIVPRPQAVALAVIEPAMHAHHLLAAPDRVVAVALAAAIVRFVDEHLPELPDLAGAAPHARRERLFDPQRAAGAD